MIRAPELSDRVLWLIGGSRRDGVHLHAVAVARTMDRASFALLDWAEEELADVPDHARLDGFGWIVLPFVDRWFERRAVDDILLELRRRGARRIALFVHDVPQPEEGAARFARRWKTYRRALDAPDLVLVSSEHEADQVAAAAPNAAVGVVPHHLSSDSPERTRPASIGSAAAVAMLGYVHPGKGIERVIDAITCMDPPPPLWLVGAVEGPHREFADELRRSARRRGVDLHMSGWVGEDALATIIASPVVPVAAHSHISASGSILRWVAGGRRPIVPDHAYTREIERRLPGTVWRVRPDPDGLRGALVRAYADPGATLHHRVFHDRDHGPIAAARRLHELLRRQLSEPTPA